jgi:hypothetical protein
MAQASDVSRELAATAPPVTPAEGGLAGVAPGVRPVRFRNTPAAWFTSDHRQISASMSAGSYVIFYTIGYADDRPQEPVASDSYAYSEMTSLGTGVRQAVVSLLGGPVAAPHCPGTPGC